LLLIAPDSRGNSHSQIITIFLSIDLTIIRKAVAKNSERKIRSCKFGADCFDLCRMQATLTICPRCFFLAVTRCSAALYRLRADPLATDCVQSGSGRYPLALSSVPNPKRNANPNLTFMVGTDCVQSGSGPYPLPLSSVPNPNPKLTLILTLNITLTLT